MTNDRHEETRSRVEPVKIFLAGKFVLRKFVVSYMAHERGD